MIGRDAIIDSLGVEIRSMASGSTILMVNHEGVESIRIHREVEGEIGSLICKEGAGSIGLLICLR